MVKLSSLRQIYSINQRSVLKHQLYYLPWIYPPFSDRSNIPLAPIYSLVQWNTKRMYKEPNWISSSNIANQTLTKFTKFQIWYLIIVPHPFKHCPFLIGCLSKFHCGQTCHKFKQQNPKSKHICFFWWLSCWQVFWRNVAYCTTYCCCHMRISMVKEFCKTEITHDSLTVVI